MFSIRDNVRRIERTEAGLATNKAESEGVS